MKTTSTYHDANWTKEENKQFEQLLIHFPAQCSDTFESIASCLPSKSTDQVRVHYEALVAAVRAIEDGLIPMPNYPDDEVGPILNNNNNNSSSSNKEQKMIQRPPKKKRNPECKWTEDEHRMFLIGLQTLGKGDWRGISRNYVPTRTSTQVASHAQKYYMKQSKLGTKKRKSTHNITLDDDDGSQLQQLDTSSNPRKQIYGDHAQGQQPIQHSDYGQCLEQQVHQSASESQLTSNAPSIELQQQKKQVISDLLHDGDIQPQEGRQIDHDYLTATLYDGPKQDSEVNQSQGSQEGQMIQQNLNMDDLLGVTEVKQDSEVNQSQGSQEGQMIQQNLNMDDLLGVTEVNQGQEAHMIQQNSNMDDQVIAPVTPTEVIQQLSAQEGKMTQQNINWDDQPIPITKSSEANLGQVLQEERMTTQNIDEHDQPRPMIHTEVSQDNVLRESEALLFDNGRNMSTWNGCYRV